MDIVKELEQLNSESFGADIIKQAQTEQEELAKKLHLLKTVSVANHIEKLVSTDLFSKFGLEFLQLSMNYDDREVGTTIEFFLLNEHQEREVSYYDASVSEQAEVLWNIFSDFGALREDLVSTQFRKKQYLDVRLEAGVKAGILDILLNDDLKKIYEYSKMQAELPSYIENNQKKMKV